MDTKIEQSQFCQMYIIFLKNMFGHFHLIFIQSQAFSQSAKHKNEVLLFKATMQPTWNTWRVSWYCMLNYVAIILQSPHNDALT